MWWKPSVWVRTSTVGRAGLAPEAGRAGGGLDGVELADEPQAAIETAAAATAAGPIAL
jgi:hypothetical protein